MGVFESSRFFPVVADLVPVARDVSQHFEAQGYEVKVEPTLSRGQHISVHKGGAFKAVLGMKTALNIELEPEDNGVRAKAGVGIFGQQTVPTMIALFIAWPVLLTQIWGMVQQSKLDDEALSRVEQSLIKHVGVTPASLASTTPSSGETKFCMGCGAALPPGAKFCPSCGVQVTATPQGA